jgi:Ankyrin repeats (many copies)
MTASSIYAAQGRTALHHACQGGHLAVASQLLARGADPFVEDAKGFTAFDFALAQRGNVDSQRPLVDLIVRRAVFAGWLDMKVCGWQARGCSLGSCV